MSHAEVGNYLNGLGGLVVLALGIFVLLPKPRTRAAIAFGLFAMGFGGNYALSHFIIIFHPPPGSWGIVTALLVYGAWVGGGVAMLAVFPKPIAPRERPALVAALLVLAGFVALAAIDHVPGSGIGLLSGILSLPTMGTLYALLVVLPLRFLLSEDRELRRQVAFAAGGLALFVGYQAGVGTGFDASQSVFRTEGPALLRATARLVVALAAGALWLLATLRPERRVARNVALVTLAMVLLGLLAAAFDVRGGHGVARVLMTAALAYGVLQHRLLGVDVKLRWTVSKSTVAAAFVAAFFLASEGAQVIFGAGNEWVGLLAAGALVFALSPLQRAAERIAEKAVPMAGAPAGEAARLSARDEAARKEDLYRNALRVALRDRQLSRDEEIHLHRLAEEMGIGAGRAHELLADVERETVREGV